MKIPKQVTVGSSKYTVHKAARLPHGKMGYVNYHRRTIDIATHDRHGFPYSPAEMYDWFWHELTHAILKDMRNPLEGNERFVHSFANRLTNAINTAKFK